MKCYTFSDQFENNFSFIVEKGELNDFFPIHTHNYTELIVVLNGHGFHKSLNGRQELQRGSVVIVPPPMAHEMEEMKHLEMYVLKFDLHSLPFIHDIFKNDPGFRSLFLQMPISQLDIEPISPFLLNEQQLLHIISLMNVMFLEFSASKPGYTTVIQTHLLALAAYLSRCFHPKQTSVSMQMERLLCTVTYMEDHICQKIHIQELADLVYLSTRQYGRIFREVYGISPSAYLAELRLNRACQLMANPDIPLNAIWEMCGFSDNAFFYRCFRHRFDITPKEYRIKLLDSII